ncbi:MAG: LptF/LptG family permease [Thermodesulfobacteriota bacterium]
MSILYRYILRQNLYYLLVSLAAGIGIYLLIDIFDRLDEFIEAQAGVKATALYFLAKIPLIVSQILPAVFLLSLLAQLSIMHRHRELTALEAAGIPLSRLAVFFLLYALIWSGLQLGFSEALGVAGQQKSEAIWEQDVRDRTPEKRTLRDVWFKEDTSIVHMHRVQPRQKKGGRITVYSMDDQFNTIRTIYRAQSFRQHPDKWTLTEVTHLTPHDFTSQTIPEVELPLRQDLTDFVAVDPKAEPESLSLWQLGRLIQELRQSGSNVERLATTWHMKLAYGFSLVVMALLALSIVSASSNIYANIPLGLVLIFVYYALFVMGGTLGEKGIVPPWVGGWLGNIFWGGIGAMRVAWMARPRR